MSETPDCSSVGGRDLGAAKAAYDVGDVELSKQAHETNTHGEEQHAG